MASSETRQRLLAERLLASLARCGRIRTRLMSVVPWHSAAPGGQVRSCQAISCPERRTPSRPRRRPARRLRPIRTSRLETHLTSRAAQSSVETTRRRRRLRLKVGCRPVAKDPRHGRVDEHDRAVLVDRDHRIGRGFHDHAVLSFGLKSRVFGLCAVVKFDRAAVSSRSFVRSAFSRATIPIPPSWPRSSAR